MDLPIISKIIEPKRKKKVLQEIKDLNKEKAHLKAEKKSLSEMGRGTSEIQDELNEVEKKLVNRYDELANIEYKEAMRGIEEESEEKTATVARVTGELKEEKKEVRKVEERLRKSEEEKEKLKEDKKELAKKINELEEKLRDREMRIKQKEGIIKELENEVKQEETPTTTTKTIEEEALAENKLLEIILKKYADHINEEERRTIQEMRELIQPNNISLREYLAEVKEEDKLRACEEAYEKIMDDFKTSEVLPVEHWMTLKQMIDHRVCDKEDKAILLCSTFRHFGADAHIAMAELEDNQKRPILIIKENEKNIVVDPNKKHPFMKYYGTMGEVKEQYRYNGNKIRRFEYIFNDREYRIPEGDI